MLWLIIPLVGVALVVQILACITLPVVRSFLLCLYQGVEFGVFGFCTALGCLKRGIGYGEAATDQDGFSLPQNTRRLVLRLLVVHPIAVGLTFVLLVGVCGLAVPRARALPRFVLALLAWTLPTFLLVLLSFLTDILLFAPHLNWPGWIIIVAIVALAVVSSVLCISRRRAVTRRYKAARGAGETEMALFSGARGYDWYAQDKDEYLVEVAGGEGEAGHARAPSHAYSAEFDFGDAVRPFREPAYDPDTSDFLRIPNAGVPQTMLNLVVGGEYEEVEVAPVRSHTPVVVRDDIPPGSMVPPYPHSGEEMGYGEGAGFGEGLSGRDGYPTTSSIYGEPVGPEYAVSSGVAHPGYLAPTRRSTDAPYPNSSFEMDPEVLRVPLPPLLDFQPLSCAPVAPPVDSLHPPHPYPHSNRAYPSDPDMYVAGQTMQPPLLYSDVGADVEESTAGSVARTETTADLFHSAVQEGDSDEEADDTLEAVGNIAQSPVHPRQETESLRGFSRQSTIRDPEPPLNFSRRSTEAPLHFSRQSTIRPAARARGDTVTTLQTTATDTALPTSRPEPPSTDAPQPAAQPDRYSTSSLIIDIYGQRSIGPSSALPDPLVSPAINRVSRLLEMLGRLLRLDLELLSLMEYVALPHLSEASSDFTLISQRGVNPRYYEAEREREQERERERERQRPSVLDANPDFALNVQPAGRRRHMHRDAGKNI